MISVRNSKNFLPCMFERIQCVRICKRGKKKIHWSELDKKNRVTDKALAHFDDFYKTIFRLKWPSVRLGLLSPNKYVAIVNNFGDVEETKTKLLNLGAIDIRILFNNHKEKLKEKMETLERSRMLESESTMAKVIEGPFRKKETVEYPSSADGNMKKELYEEEVGEDGEYYSGSDSDSEDEKNRESSLDTKRMIDPNLGIEAASLQEFVPASKLFGMSDYVDESQYYNYYKENQDMKVETELEHDLNFPEHLNVWTFDRGDFSKYPPPRRGALGLLNYYLLDGSSILPVLALGIKPGDTVLDMCAAPGGKSLAAFQTLYPKLLVCNDITRKRKEKLTKVFCEYLYEFPEESLTWRDMLMITNLDGAGIDDKNLYDKILVDVPCTNDRLSLAEEDNNIFRPDRIKERLRLPEIQAALLSNALRLVRPGGTVVYSTCTLSPIQNDGVVGMALRKMWEETKMNFKIIDQTPSLESTSYLYNYGKGIGLKYGHLVVPFLPSNFGPMYFCKIVKKHN